MNTDRGSRNSYNLRHFFPSYSRYVVLSDSEGLSTALT